MATQTAGETTTPQKDVRDKIVVQNLMLNGLTKFKTLESPFVLMDVVMMEEKCTVPPIDEDSMYRSKPGMMEFEGQYRWCNVRITHCPKDKVEKMSPFLRVAAYDLESGSLERLIGTGLACLSDIKIVGNIQMPLYAEDEQMANFECRVQLLDDDLWSDF